MSAAKSRAQRDRGKWSMPGVPHKGWWCIGLKDLKGLFGICEMCETQSIRYVHYMEHPDYPDVLGAGSVCAGHMEGDYAAPQQREKQAISLAARRSRWMNTKWRQSAKGNPYLNRSGFNIVLYPSGRHWAFRIERRNSGQSWRRAGYATIDDAKLAAFERFTKLQQ
ncbi:MAG: hypothetical protein OXQ32_02310 [bacterium]|nr:hypothetical protein [bacterium]